MGLTLRQASPGDKQLSLGRSDLLHIVAAVAPSVWDMPLSQEQGPVVYEVLLASGFFSVLSYMTQEEHREMGLVLVLSAR